MCLMPTRGDRPRTAHARPKRRTRPEAAYESAADWPSWTDEEVLTADVHPSRWPNVGDDGRRIARVRFTVPDAIDLYFSTVQYPLDGPQEREAG